MHGFTPSDVEAKLIRGESIDCLLQDLQPELLGVLGPELV